MIILSTFLRNLYHGIGFLPLLYFTSFLYMVHYQLPIAYVSVFLLVTVYVFVKSRILINLYLLLAASLSIFPIISIGFNFPFQYVLNILLGMAAGIVIYSEFKYLDSSTIYKKLSVAQLSLVFVFILETFLRLTKLGPSSVSQEVLNFHEAVNSYYQFKYHSIFYADSNTTSIALLCIFAVNECLYLNYNKRSRIVLTIVPVMIFLTFSFSGIATFLLYCFYRIFRFSFIFILGFAAPSVIALITVIGSYGFRLEAFQLFFQRLNELPLNRLLFGGDYYLTRSEIYEPHSLVIELLYSLGIVPSLLVLSSVFVFLYTARFTALPLYALIFLPSIIFYPYFGLMFSFTSVAIILSLSLHKNTNENSYRTS